MTEAEVLSVPSSQTLDPAAFFAAPPNRPSDLISSRKGLLRDVDNADKFQGAVREARASGNSRVAAAGSWVTGEYQKALEHVDGDDELAVFIHGTALLELDRHQEAFEILKNKVSATDPALAAAAVQAHLAVQDLDGADKAIGQAAISDADQAFFHARIRELQGFPKEACNAYNEILERFPEHFESRFRLALRADLYGDDQLAIQHYEFLLQERPVPVSVLINLGVLYEDHNDFEKACGCYSAVLKRDPSHPRARLYFRDAHESLDMYYDEDLERKEDRLMQVLRTPITEFELSVRARNCLANMDIRTLADLVSHSEPELLEFKNFGETSLNEIKRVLNAKGLRLGMRREDGSFIIPEEFESKLGSLDGEDMPWLGPLDDEQRQAMDMQISGLNLSVRCHRALVERLNLQKVGDILRFSEEDLLGQPNFGITSLNELTSKLVEFNLKLRSGRGDEYSGD